MGRHPNREVGARHLGKRPVDHGGPPPPDTFAEYLSEDPSGAVWLSTLKGLFLLRDSHLEQVGPSDLLSQFRADPKQGFSGSTLRFLSADAGGWSTLQLVAVDPEGGIWHTSGTSVSRQGKEIVRLSEEGGFSVRGMTLTRDGSVWLATNHQGLHQLRPARVDVVGSHHGLPHRNIYAILEDHEGSIWIGDGVGGLARWDGEVTPIPTSPSRPQLSLDDTVFSIYDDPRQESCWSAVPAFNSSKAATRTSRYDDGGTRSSPRSCTDSWCAPCSVTGRVGCFSERPTASGDRDLRTRRPTAGDFNNCRTLAAGRYESSKPMATAESGSARTGSARLTYEVTSSSGSVCRMA